MKKTITLILSFFFTLSLFANDPEIIIQKEGDLNTFKLCQKSACVLLGDRAYSSKEIQDQLSDERLQRNLAIGGTAYLALSFIAYLNADRFGLGSSSSGSAYAAAMIAFAPAFGIVVGTSVITRGKISDKGMVGAGIATLVAASFVAYDQNRDVQVLNLVLSGKKEDPTQTIKIAKRVDKILRKISNN